MFQYKCLSSTRFTTKLGYDYQISHYLLPLKFWSDSSSSHVTLTELVMVGQSKLMPGYARVWLYL